ncbi:MAG: TIGR02186 family protein [Zhengella sp.]|uniref:TIGR02186 family protein n=1 Tax=Zhengella sp. TaxID=2282762 RepID=UPI003529A338|nr:TIGR02186 family protein [Brucellaceae bacterium]
MAGRRTWLACLALPALLAALPVQAQAQAQEPLREAIQIGLSTDKIGITSSFSGADLTIFGALENADPEVRRTGRYDVVVVLEGPPRLATVRRKDRFFGLWINRQSETFQSVPASYSIATTRAIQDITTETSYRQLALGAPNLAFNQGAAESGRIAEFSEALRTIKRDTGLYTERIGGVRFLSQNLFRASLAIPANVPVGTHRARAFLFRNGVFIDEMSAPLVIVKSGFEAAIYNMAKTQGLTYGLFAVALAVVTGWLGRLLFRRD